MAKLHLEFVTPERRIAHDEVDEVQLPLADGYAGILPGHAPMLAAIRTGQMYYRKGGETHYGFVSGGFGTSAAGAMFELRRTPGS